MFLSKLVSGIREQFKASRAPLRDGEQAQAFASDAYDACVEWFGSPIDPKRSYNLDNHAGDESSCGYVLGRYVIALSLKMKTREQLCGTIGHEMYHRVTVRRSTLRREPWIDEMLASMAGSWFLERHGFTEYSQFLRDNLANKPDPVDFSMLRAYRRMNRVTALRRNVPRYPPNFYPDVARVGLALAHLVGRDNLCRLSHVNSWDEWLDGLRVIQRVLVCRFLEMPVKDKNVIYSADAHKRMGFALRVTGRSEAAVREYRLSLVMRPDEADAYFQLACAYLNLKRNYDAVASFTKAASLDTRNFWSASNAADEYFRRQNLPDAIFWYKQALTRRPDDPRALFYLGNALAENGDVSEARETWRKAAELDDKTYSGPAREAIVAWKDETDKAKDG